MAIFKNNPYGSFNFNVVVEGAEAAAFSTVVVPTVEIDVVEYRDGNDRTSQPRQVVGLTKYTNLVLKRGVASRRDLWESFRSGPAGGARPARHRGHAAQGRAEPVTGRYVLSL